MELPKFHEIFIPVLEILKNSGPTHYNDLTQKIKTKYYSNLPIELLNQTLTTGQNTLSNRIGWTISYLNKAKFVYRPERSIVQITEKGKKILESGQLSLVDLKKDPDYIEAENLRKSQKNLKDSSNFNDEDTPEDVLEKGFTSIEEQTKQELLIKLTTQVNPYDFEKIILKLFKKMGYGDFIETKKSHDGGIDGIINQDELGLEKIYIQTKLYQKDNIIRKTAITNFIGAMSGDTNKGIFVTTSSFDSKAEQKAHDAIHSITLINGEKLVDLMYKFGIGVQVKSIYEIKGIDEDFFNEI
jgi:restriction system protein